MVVTAQLTDGIGSIDVGGIRIVESTLCQFPQVVELLGDRRLGVGRKLGCRQVSARDRLILSHEDAPGTGRDTERETQRYDYESPRSPNSHGVGPTC